jgi:hypothetical protein
VTDNTWAIKGKIVESNRPDPDKRAKRSQLGSPIV